MKVICIDAATRVEHRDLVEGKTYTADPNNECFDGCCFLIVESGAKWNKNRFAPLSNIDETEMVSEGV